MSNLFSAKNRCNNKNNGVSYPPLTKHILWNSAGRSPDRYPLRTQKGFFTEAAFLAKMKEIRDCQKADGDNESTATEEIAAALHEANRAGVNGVEGSSTCWNQQNNHY